MVHLVRCDNSIVTDYYFDVLSIMFSKCGESVINYMEKTSKNKRDIFVVATLTDFVNIYRKGFHNIVFWMQGIEAEESFLKHKSSARKFILDRMTKFALIKSKIIFFVSEEMQVYEGKKYGIDTSSRSFIMPCFNTKFNKSAILTPDKYNYNTFAYVGSLSKWQCFEDTVVFYKKIEQQVPFCKLKVFTSEKSKAKTIIENIGIKQYTIDFVSPEKLNDELSSVKFGFVLRDDIAVNQVATPTKLSSYLASGVIPIYSDCIKDFHKQTQRMKYRVPIHNKTIISSLLINLCHDKIDNLLLMKEYSNLFKTYYNPEYYVELYHEKMKRLLRNMNV